MGQRHSLAHGPAPWPISKQPAKTPISPEPHRRGRLAKEPRSGTSGAEPLATYEFSRLCFRRDVIEALAPQDAFRVITPTGVFQMTKADFHRAFSNVAQSRSYLENGLYHYPKLPARAEEFRIV